MERTFVITVPDRRGVLEEVSRIFSGCGVNLKGLSYNRAVDLRKLFVTAEAGAAELAEAEAALAVAGFTGEERLRRPLLLELRLPDRPGVLWNVAALLKRENTDVIYLNSHSETGREAQAIKLGCRPMDEAHARRIIEMLSALGELNVPDFDPTEQILDNRGFYRMFSESMQQLLGLPESARKDLMIWANVIMQHLDERGEEPHATFEKVREFARFMVDHRAGGAEGFRTQITRHRLSPRVEAVTLQPPCGSNTTALLTADEVLLVDGGFCCNRDVTVNRLREAIPDWEARQKTMFLTHADADHIGLATLCDRILVNRDILRNFELEAAGQDDLREQTALGRAYMRLNKLFSAYESIEPGRLTVIGEKTDEAPLSPIGTLDFGDLHFEVLQGSGGHVCGEMVLLETQRRIACTGDNLVNIAGFSPEQAEFNRLAPFLMNSVNVDSAKATVIRKLLTARTKGWLIFPGHGAPIDRE